MEKQYSLWRGFGRVQGLSTVLSLCFVVLFASPARADQSKFVRSVPWSNWAKDFLEEKYPSFKKDFAYKNFKGGRCNPGYDVKVHLETEVKDLDIDLKDDGSIEAKVWLENMGGNATGLFRSHVTLCRDVNLGHTITSDGAYLRAIVKFTNADNDPMAFQLQIVETRLDRLRLSSWLPGSVEKWLTAKVNSSLKLLWKSRFGDWLTQKIAAFVKTQLPKPAK